MQMTEEQRRLMNNVYTMVCELKREIEASNVYMTVCNLKRTLEELTLSTSPDEVSLFSRNGKRVLDESFARMHRTPVFFKKSEIKKAARKWRARKGK